MKRTTLLIVLGTLSFGVLAQKLEPTATEALVQVTTVNSTGEPKQGEKISFTSTKGKTWSVVTNEQGLAELLIPKGATYSISYMTLDGDNEYSQIEIPDAEGKVQFDLRLEYEQPKVYTLRNVNFETGSAVVKSSSYPYLDQLVELLKVKTSMRIEIGGHTDNVGSAENNLTLSEKRARTVRQYLLDHGIAANRVVAVGYGQEKPIASNNLPEGREQNRRTEVRVLQE